MERHNFKSVAFSRVDSLPVTTVRSAHAFPSVSPVGPASTKSLSFSISKILGLDETAATSKHSPNSVIVETPNASRPGYQTPCLCGKCSGTNPRSSPYSDYASSSSDSETDQVPTHSEQPPKRHRAAFSPIEVSELERAFKRQPYFLSKEEDELVWRIGIPPKRQRFWFQNRRVKQRKQAERNTLAVYQTNPSDQRGCHYSRIPSGRPELTAGQTHDERAYFTQLFHRLENQPHLLHKPVSAENQLPFQSSQLRRSSHTDLPALHPDLSKIRLAMKPVRPPFRRTNHRYQPY